MPEPIHHPTTGEPIAQGPGEQLQRIAWPGAPVVVVTRPGSAGELLYRLARPRDKNGSKEPRAEGCKSCSPSMVPAPLAAPAVALLLAVLTDAPPWRVVAAVLIAVSIAVFSWRRDR